MSFSVTKILDHVTPYDVRGTTFLLRYPRFIHAEMMTHRVFSRNASSSRAIPVSKIIEDVMDDPAISVHWGKNQPGMQASEETQNLVCISEYNDGTCDPFVTAKEAWLLARDKAVQIAEAFTEAGYHKQVVNRLLEPFAHISVVVTSTNFSNFFALRCHEDAEPNIRVLAEMMEAEYHKTAPNYLVDGVWHLPFIKHEDWDMADNYLISRGRTVGPSNTKFVDNSLIEVLIGVSVARCARTSYRLHDGSPTTVEADFDLYNRLLGSVPLHASPAEHQFTTDTKSFDQWKHPQYHGNLNGVIQYRKLLPGECQ